MKDNEQKRVKATAKAHEETKEKENLVIWSHSIHCSRNLKWTVT